MQSSDSKTAASLSSLLTVLNGVGPALARKLERMTRPEYLVAIQEFFEAENARLRDLLEARAQVRDEVRVAEIMAVDANPYRHNIVIDIGKFEGVYDGQAIVDAAGVIGQVIETGSEFIEAARWSATNPGLSSRSSAGYPVMVISGNRAR